MLDFCGEHNISCMIEKISMAYVNQAMERLAKGDVKYRFVIDVTQGFQVSMSEVSLDSKELEI